jgi:hypothetical protein
MISIIISSISLPLLFNQGRKAYDIVQFGPYSLVLMAIFTTATLQLIKQKISKKYYLILIAIFMIISLPSNNNSIKNRYSSSSFNITKEELTGYYFLANTSEKESVIMIYPTQRNDAILLVAALSQRPTYYSGKSFAEISGENIEERDEKWRSFFRNIDPEQRNKVIKEGSIDYLLLSHSEDRDFNPAGINLEEIFSNEEMIIHKIQ